MDASPIYTLINVFGLHQLLRQTCGSLAGNPFSPLFTSESLTLSVYGLVFGRKHKASFSQQEMRILRGEFAGWDNNFRFTHYHSIHCFWGKNIDRCIILQYCTVLLIMRSMHDVHCDESLNEANIYLYKWTQAALVVWRASLLCFILWSSARCVPNNRWYHIYIS